jgi:hypothetical protein
MAIHLRSLFLLTLAAGPALADSTIISRPQMAEYRQALDARQIEEQLYRQGYHRISHIDLDGSAYTARALDGNQRPVFLGIAPDSGEVIEAHPMK